MSQSIIYIMGVSGSGKTTIGELLATKINIPFFDADDYHSNANKAKMKAGIPLNDEDRESWLKQLNELAVKQADIAGAIIACSALKEKYRVELTSHIADPWWIFLQGSYQLLHDRIANRQGHFMPVELLASQIQTLEIPENAFTVDIDQTPEKIVQLIEDHLQKSS